MTVSETWIKAREPELDLDAPRHAPPFIFWAAKNLWPTTVTRRADTPITLKLPGAVPRASPEVEEAYLSTVSAADTRFTLGELLIAGAGSSGDFSLKESAPGAVVATCNLAVFTHSPVLGPVLWLTLDREDTVSNLTAVRYIEDSSPALMVSTGPSPASKEEADFASARGLSNLLSQFMAGNIQVHAPDQWRVIVHLAFRKGALLPTTGPTFAQMQSQSRLTGRALQDIAAAADASSAVANRSLGKNALFGVRYGRAIQSSANDAQSSVTPASGKTKILRSIGAMGSPSAKAKVLSPGDFYVPSAVYLREGCAVPAQTVANRATPWLSAYAEEAAAELRSMMNKHSQCVLEALAVNSQYLAVNTLFANPFENKEKASDDDKTLKFEVLKERKSPNSQEFSVTWEPTARFCDTIETQTPNPSTPHT